MACAAQRAYGACYGRCEHLAGLPPLAARLVKKFINNGQNIPNLRDAALADMYRFYVLDLTEDKAEGYSAWRERREPNFR